MPSVRPSKWQLAQVCQPSRGEPVGRSRRCVPAGRSKLPREEKKTSAPTVTTSLASEPGGGSGAVRITRSTRSLSQVDHARRCARRSSRRTRACPASLTTMPSGFLPALSPLVAGFAGIVEVDVAGGVCSSPVKLSVAVGGHVELDQQVAAGGHDVGLRRRRCWLVKPIAHGLAKKSFFLPVSGVRAPRCRLRNLPSLASRLAAAGDAADHVDERLGVDVEAERAGGRGGDVRQERRSCRGSRCSAAGSGSRRWDRASPSPLESTAKPVGLRRRR